MKDDGTIVKEFANGTILIVHVDGSKVQRTAEGVELIQHADGTTTQINMDGTRIEMLLNKTKIQTNPDGSTVSVFPDGSQEREMKNLEGELVVMKISPDGSKTQKNADGTMIRVQPDGTVIQRNCDGTEITLSPQGDKTINHASGKIIRIFKDGRVVRMDLQCEGTTSYLEPSNISTTLRVYSDGTQLQESSNGDWKWILKKKDGYVVQKAFDGSLLISGTTPGESYYYQSSNPRQIIRVSKTKMKQVFEYAGDLVLDVFMADNEPQRVIALAFAEMKKAESHFDLTAQGDLRVKFQQQLLRSERTLATWSEDSESKLSSYKSKIQYEKTRASSFAEHVSKLKLDLETSLSAHAVTTKQLVSNEKELNALKRDYAKEISKPANCVSTQWSPFDAQEIRFTTPRTKSVESEYSDPELNRVIIENLKRTILLLEHDKQEVEDKLIDLKFSLTSRPNSGAFWKPGRRNKQNRLLLLVQQVLHIKKRKEEDPSASFTAGPMSRKISFVMAMERLKKRDDEKDLVIDTLRTAESRQHSENKKLTAAQAQVTDENVHLKARLAQVEERLENALEFFSQNRHHNSADSSETSSVGSSETANNMMEIMNCIEDNKETNASSMMPITLSDISPML